MTVEVDAEGNRTLVAATPDCAGFIVDSLQPNTIYFYTFFNSINKKVAKGGKVMFKD